MSLTPEAPPPDGVQVRWALRVTIRCLTDDLDRSGEDAHRDVAELEDPTVEKFVHMRSQNPIGGETIHGIKAKPCYSLHQERYRGATWHDEDNNVVWLLAVGYHEESSHRDAYEHFSALDAAGELLPTPQDYELLFESQDESFIDAIRSDVESLLEEARGAPGLEVRGVLGSQVQVSLVVDGGQEGRERRCLAISQRFTGSGPRPPKEWFIMILALVFPWTNDPLLETTWQSQIGGREGRTDESIWAAEGPESSSRWMNR